MWWLVVAVMLCAAMVAGVVYHHNQMTKQWEEATYLDVMLVREAAESSVVASNTHNPVVALLEAVQATKTLEVLVRRHGLQRVTEASGVNVAEMITVLNEQRDHILQQLVQDQPQLMPAGLLNKYAGYVRDREVLRHDQVTSHHLDWQQVQDAPTEDVV